MPDAERRILLPVQGVSDTMAFTDTPPVVAPPDSLLNIVPFDVVKNRGRLGTRPAWQDFAGQQFSGGVAIQGMGTFSRVETVTGYREVNCESFLSRLGPDTKVQTLRGQVWMLNKEFAMRRQWYENVTAGGASDYGPDSAAASPSVTCIALSPDNTRVYIGETYNDGTSLVARITCLQRVNWLDMDDNRDNAQVNTVVLWTRKISDGANPVFVNQITATATHVFVASNHLVRILSAADGTNAAQPSFNCNGWSNEVLSTKLSPDGLFLYVLFLGVGYTKTLDATVGNTSGAGVTVAANAPAVHFRSGIMKCRLGTGSSVLTQVRWSTQLAADDDYFEGGDTGGGVFVSHGYLRFFEAIKRHIENDLDQTSPDRGLYPTGFAVCPDGGLVVSHANAAWGPKNTQYPDQIGPSVTKFDANGNIVWRASLPTFTEDRDGDGYYNDLPGLSSETCSAHAIAVDADGDVYVGGRVNNTGSGGSNFHKILGDPGTFTSVVLWSIRLGDASIASTIFENGITVDPADNQPVICGTRSTAWTGVVSAAPAHIWKRRSLDGGILAHFDLAASNITALSAVCDGGGNTYYCSDLVI